VAAADDLNDVSDGRAGRRSNDADALGKGRERLARAIEQAFEPEAVAKLLEREL
jgi:hypothetical protein